MTYLHSGLFALHILFGSIALVLFWVPFFTKKGQLNHVKFGNYYKNSMYAVAATGALMAIIVLAIPLTIKAKVVENSNDLQISAFYLRLFWAFLLYLAVLSFSTTRHAITVLKVRANNAQMRTFWYLAPLVTLTALGPVFIYLGMTYEQPLHIVFGSIGMIVGISMLQYCFKKEIKPREWILAHVDSMIGSGIGAYSAFLAFGGRTMLSDLGQWQIAFWVAPGVIGVIASWILCKKYQKVFSVA